MAQDLAASGVELPARYTERQASDRGAVARYYQESGGWGHLTLTQDCYREGR